MVKLTIHDDEQDIGGSKTEPNGGTSGAEEVSHRVFLARREYGVTQRMFSCLLVASMLGSCDPVGACKGDYNDYNHGDRCQLQLPEDGVLELSTPRLQLTPVESDVPASATLLVTGSSKGAAADGYIVDVAIRGELAKPAKDTMPGDGCASAFELAPASDSDVCIGVSPSLLHCVFNAVGQLHFTVSTLRTQPISECSVIVASGAEATAGAALEIVYPLDALTLVARTPANLGLCGDAATPCIFPPATSMAYCAEAPACDAVTQQTQIYFATERGGLQIGSGQELDVLLGAIPQTDDAGPLWFSTEDCADNAPVNAVTIDGRRGESNALNVCVGGRGGRYELRGTIGDGVVLSDSVFVDFPARPPRVTGTLSADKKSFEVHVLACDDTGVAGANVILNLEYDGLPADNFALVTDGAGRASVLLDTDPNSATVTLTDWNTSCIYPVG